VSCPAKVPWTQKGGKGEPGQQLGYPAVLGIRAWYLRGGNWIHPLYHRGTAQRSPSSPVTPRRAASTRGGTWPAPPTGSRSRCRFPMLGLPKSKAGNRLSPRYMRLHNSFVSLARASLDIRYTTAHSSFLLHTIPYLTSPFGSYTYPRSHPPPSPSPAGFDVDVAPDLISSADSTSSTYIRRGPAPRSAQTLCVLARCANHCITHTRDPSATPLQKPSSPRYPINNKPCRDTNTSGVSLLRTRIRRLIHNG
jgi:hypothetical protein